MSASAVFVLDLKGKVFTEYFKELEEESIQDNFVVVYELLDELMDFGFPQTTDSKILQEYITQQGNKLEVAKTKVPTTVTNAVSWRSEGIEYKKNEVFIDVIEGGKEFLMCAHFCLPSVENDELEGRPPITV